MGKKKTHEEYVAELAIKNPKVEVLDTYIDRSTKILHRCKIDGHEWLVRPFKLLGGTGCPLCASNARKSHDKYVNKLSFINPNIEVLDVYVDAKTKIKHKCKVDGYEWLQCPNKILSGRGCPVCTKNKLSEAKRKTHEEYIIEAKVLNPNVKVIGTYINAKTKITHHCLIHNIYWEATPDDILHGHGCPQCKLEKIGDKKRKTHDEYVAELAIKNPTVEVIGTYINSDTKITHRCKIHDYYWDAYPNNILKGCGCRKCQIEKTHLPFTKTHEQYILEVKNANPNIEVLGQYINSHTPILHKCLIHGIEWETTPSGVLGGSECPECVRIKRINSKLKTHEQYIKEVSEISPNIEVIERYIDCRTNILHRCKIHDYYWKTRPNNILNGCGCPVCKESKGEKNIRKWLVDNNIVFVTQKVFADCKDKLSLPFDFYLPDYNSAIEYDGEQHYEPIEFFGGQEAFKIRVKHDNIKNEYCKNNGISLLRIPYFKNVEEELNNFLFI